MVAGLSLSADAFMANRELGFLMPTSLSAYMGGLKRDSFSIDIILGYYYSRLRLACRTPFPITRWMYEGVVFPRHGMYKEDLTLNNLQWLICPKTQLNQILYI